MPIARDFDYKIWIFNSDGDLFSERRNYAKALKESKFKFQRVFCF